MARKTENKSAGRQSTFSGEKEGWLAAFEGELAALGKDKKAVGKLYTEIATRWFVRYGYDLPFGKNVNGDPDDHPPPEAPKPMPEEERKRRDAMRAKFRTKLGQWYRNRANGKKIHAAAIRGILSTMRALSGPGQRPRRNPTIATYSRKYYASRVKPEFDKKWAVAKATIPESERLAMSQEFVREAWKDETPEIKAEVEKEADETYEEALTAWRAGRTVEELSAEEYHEALESLSDVGIPLADALAERLGMHVVILAVGPVGKEKGEVSLHSLFSDTAGRRTTKTWPEFDKRAFTAVEASIVRYGRALYSKEDSHERTWPPLETATPVVDPTGMEGMISMPPRETQRPAPAPAPAPAAAAPAPAPPAAPTPAPAPAPAPAAAPAPAPAPDADADADAPAPPPSPPSSPREDEGDGVDRSEWALPLAQLHEFLVKKAWGPRWMRLLEHLVTYEWGHHHMEATSFSLEATCRPWAVGQWMKEHRPVRDYPIEKSEGGVEQYGRDLVLWWKQLGPRDRWAGVAEGAWASRDDETWCADDWGKFDKEAKNGVMLMVQCIAWWGQAIWNAGAVDGLGGEEAALRAHTEWNALLDDVSWVLGGLAEKQAEMRRESDGRRAAEGDVEEIEKEGTSGGKGTKKKGTKKKVAAKTAPGGGKTAASVGKAAPKRQAMTSTEDVPAAKRRRSKRGLDEDVVQEGPAPAPKERPRPRPLMKGKKGAASDAEGITPSSAVEMEGPTPANPPEQPQQEMEVDMGSGSSSAQVGGPQVGGGEEHVEKERSGGLDTAMQVDGSDPRTGSIGSELALDQGYEEEAERDRKKADEEKAERQREVVGGKMNLKEGGVNTGDADTDLDPFGGMSAAELALLTAEEMEELILDHDANEEEEEDD
ncbi:hypothetical protein DFH06DRAFT_1326471 [Mycena polygramma]|nr:hypothetical protein DFH06DRAFT_1326471 [Mycena polygramma]